jgi:hypothetical protein
MNKEEAVFPTEDFFEDAVQKRFEEEFSKNHLGHVYSSHCFCVLCIMERGETKRLGQFISEKSKELNAVAEFAKTIRAGVIRKSICNLDQGPGRSEFGCMDSVHKASNLSYNQEQHTKLWKNTSDNREFRQRCDKCQREHLDLLCAQMAMDKSAIEDEIEPAPQPPLLTRNDFLKVVAEQRKHRDILTTELRKDVNYIKSTLKEYKQAISEKPNKDLLQLTVQQEVEKRFAPVLKELVNLAFLTKDIIKQNSQQIDVVNALTVQQEVFRLQIVILEEAFLNIPEHDPYFHQAKEEFENLRKNGCENI